MKAKLFSEMIACPFQKKISLLFSLLHAHCPCLLRFGPRLKGIQKKSIATPWCQWSSKQPPKGIQQSWRVPVLLPPISLTFWSFLPMVLKYGPVTTPWDVHVLLIFTLCYICCVSTAWFPGEWGGISDATFGGPHFSPNYLGPRSWFPEIYFCFRRNVNVLLFSRPLLDFFIDALVCYVVFITFFFIKILQPLSWTIRFGRCWDPPNWGDFPTLLKFTYAIH